MSAVSVKHLAFAVAMGLLASSQSAIACSIMAPSADYDEGCYPTIVCTKVGEPASSCDGAKWHTPPCAEVNAAIIKTAGGYWEGDKFFLKAKQECPSKLVIPTLPPAPENNIESSK